MKPRGVRLSIVVVAVEGDVDATTRAGLSSRGGEAMTLTRSDGGGAAWSLAAGFDSEPTMESMLKANLGLLLPEEQLTPVEAVVAAGGGAVGELTDTTKGFDGAIGSMLKV